MYYYHISYLQVINNCMCLLVIQIFASVHATIQSSVYAFGCTSFVLMLINVRAILIWKLLVECALFFVFESLHYLSFFSAIFTLVV
jgi:hypothetical protein